ncbi:MAG: hypothetical protein NVSMB9_08980 [Isosphaeraceae bacterium]
MASNETAILAATGLILFGLSFVLSLASCTWARRWPLAFFGEFVGVVRGQWTVVPQSGGLAFGLAVAAAFSGAFLVGVFGRPFLPGVIARYIDGLWFRSGELGVILGLAMLMLAAGYLLDTFEFGWRSRLTVQVLAATMLVASGTRVTLFWPFTYPLIGGLVTALWIVLMVNAFAFLDNMDGLAAGVGVIASLLFAATQSQIGSLFAPAALVIVAGGLAGLLPYSFYPAKMSLGTGGSWLVGFLLGALTVAGTYYRYGVRESPNIVLSPLLVMAVPLYESAVVLLFWLGERDPWFRGNPRYFSYRLGAVGLSPTHSVWLLLLVSLGAGLGALLLRRLDAFGTVVLLGQTACLIGVVAIVELTAIRRNRAS